MWSKYTHNPVKPGDVVYREGPFEIVFSSDDPPVYQLIREGRFVNAFESTNARDAYRAAMTELKAQAEALQGFRKGWEDYAEGRIK